MRTAVELLGESGPLASAMSGYEPRPGQLAMAENVERVLQDDGVLLCEAGTGTGKTLAYLVPAILSGRKVIVSTATKALQEQIFFKDLPLIERSLGLLVSAALMKGLSNYVCRRRYRDFLRSDEASRPRHSTALRALAAWLPETHSGDRSELMGLNEADPVWSQVTSSSDTRLGQRCEHYGECFVTRMRREADDARIVVVNHHLFFADLALRGPHPGRVIPDYDAVIFDEAHRLEDIATDFFGLRVSEARVGRVLSDAEHTFRSLGEIDSLLSKDRAALHLDAVRAASGAFFETLGRAVEGGEPRATLGPDVWQGNAQGRWLELDGAMEGLVAASTVCSGRLASRDGEEFQFASGASSAALADALDLVGRRGQDIRDDLRNIVEGAPGQIAWFERGQRGASISSSPVSLERVFRQKIFDVVPAVVLTSATLSSRGSAAQHMTGETALESSAFPFIRSRLGLTETEPPVSEACIPSPFDFAERSLLYTPADLPEPGAPDFVGRAVERIAQLVQLTDGGAFVLTTSVRSMKALHAGLRGKLGTRLLLMQGDGPKSQVLARFRTAGNAVLVATMSFWEGVDVPGRALRLVVLDKIPFPVPSDPIVLARSRFVEEAGGNPFMEYHVPVARISLKQGFGRLIRHSEDRGVVALLDSRVQRRGYGKAMLSALPPATRTSDIADVERFWAGRLPE